MDDVYPQEVIKEYLEYNRLSSTLECFQAEIKTKTLISSQKAKKNTENATQPPKLYMMCMGEGAKASVHSATEKRLEQSLKVHANLLKSSKKIFEIAVACAKVLEEHKISEDTVSVYKVQLSKLQHDVGIRLIHSEESAILSAGYVQEIRNKLINYVQSKDYSHLAQELLKVRVESLSVPQHNRRHLVEVLEENDIFGGSLNLLLAIRNHSVCTATMALISILASTDNGKRYVLGNNAVYICSLLIKQLQSEEKGSVCQRFILAGLSKLSLDDSACLCMIEHNLIEWIVQHVLVHNNHPFMLLFGSALIVNLLKFDAGQAHVSQNRDGFIKILLGLLTFSKSEGLDLDVIYYCLLACSFIIKVFPDANVVTEIGTIVELVSDSEKSEESAKQRIFDVCNKIIHKTIEEKHEKKNKNEEEELIFFECFTDESPIL